MNKGDLKSVLKVYGVCTACAVVLSGSITVGVCVADGTVSGSDILNDTRYSAIGTDILNEIIDTLEDIQNGEITDPTGVVENTLNVFAKKFAEKSVKDTVDNSVDGAVTINDSYAVMAKRRINYPYNGYYEIQYIYIYVNKNDSGQTPQQFGNYTVAPNTIFMVRQTNFDGVKAFSIPIAENGLVLQMGSAPSGAAVSIKFNGNQDDTFIYDDETGRQTVGFRHYGNDFQPVRLNLINNNVNTIVDNFLIDYYSNNQADYNNYIGSQRTLTNFEAFIGTGYDYGQSSGIMGGSFRPFYITTAFFNTNGYDEDDAPIERINTYFTTDPDNIDPSKPPAFVMPRDNPLSSGNTINNNTVNNYNDYGVTMLDGELHLDPDILAGALGGLITPDFSGAVAGVFAAQPEIGLGFDTPLVLDLPELVQNYLESITVYPVEPWQPPSYPAVDTTPYIPATYPVVPTATYPENYLEDMGDTLQDGWDIFDGLGLLGFLVPIVIFCLLWRFTGG